MPTIESRVLIRVSFVLELVESVVDAVGVNEAIIFMSNELKLIIANAAALN